MLAFFGALFESFFHLRGIFLSNFRPLEALWGSYGRIFGVKKWFGHQTCPKIAPRSVSPFRGHLFGDLLEYVFRIFCIFRLKRRLLKYVPFVLRFLGRPELSTGPAHMQSVQAGAVQTHFFSFAFFLKNSSLGSSFWVDFGSQFHQQLQF